MERQELWYAANLPLTGEKIVDVGANVGKLSQFFWDKGGRTNEIISPGRYSARTNGPRPTISEGGVVTLQASRKVPLASAGSSLWLGRMGSESRIARPGPWGAARRTMTVAWSGASTSSGRPPTRRLDASSLFTRSS